MEITIIYGTETGNSESLAQDARAKLTKLGHQALKDSSEDLSEVSYAVFALGDEFYENFCQAGKDFDSFLERLKAQRLLPVVLSNGDHDDTFPEWVDAIAEKLS